MSTRLRFGVYKRDNETKPWKVQLPDTHNPRRAVYIGVFASLPEALEARDAARADPAEYVRAQRLARLQPSRLNAAATATIPLALRPYIKPLTNGAFRLTLPFNGRSRIIGEYSTLEAAIAGTAHGKALLSDLAQQAWRAHLAQLAGQGDPDAERLINDPRYDYEDLPLEPEPALQEALATIDQLAQELPHVP